MTGRIYYHTQTLCPECEEILPGDVRAISGKVYVTRTCPKHGFFKGLVCSDLSWYENLSRFDVPPVKPPYQTSDHVHGCPRDCGLCPSHRQKAGTAAIEISNVCDMACPVCLADNTGTFELSVEEFADSVERLANAQGGVDVLTISGGEPTIHPHLMDMLDRAANLRIGRIIINSNGYRIAEDDVFLDELAKRKNVYVCLHHDGAKAREIRGMSPEIQARALERLGQWKINSIPLILAAPGINEAELGSLAADLIVRQESIKTVMFSLMAYTGRGFAMFPRESGERLTIPEALRLIEDGSGGRIRKRDFIPLPMPNPLCAAIGYFLVDKGRITPLIPIAGVERVVSFLKNSHFGEPNAEYEQFFRDVIYDVYANPDAFPDSREILASIRSLVDRLFPPSGPALTHEERKAISEEHIKCIYLMQFMDAWTFDSVRMSKCSCQHILPGGRMAPSCGYYCYHRKSDPRFI